MTRNLSISHAWEETKSRIAADGRLYVTVALALLALPSAIGQFAFPMPEEASGGALFIRSPDSVGAFAAMIVIAIVGLIGQLAIIRLAIGPSLSVGEAIVHGARRTPAYIAAALLVLLALALLSIPFVLALAALGASFEPGAAPPPSAILFILLYVALLLFVTVRMLPISAVASAEPAGPIAILKRTWELTRGHWLRIFGFLLLYMIALLIVLAAVALVTNLIVSFLFGEVEPMTVAALIIALVQAIASAIATTMFIVMLARIYVQLSGGAPVETTVPRSGT